MAFWGVFTMPRPEWWMFWVAGVGVSGAVWLAGRAVKYVLTD